MTVAARLATQIALALATLLPLAAQADDDTIVTDRPGFPESSNVIGASRLQLETSIALERDNNAGVRSRTLGLPTLLRIGVGHDLELRIETDGPQRSRVDSAGATIRERGAADSALGIKWHLADQDGKLPSMALLLHADLDTGSPAFRGAGVRPSLRLATEWDLPGGLSLAVMPGVSREFNADNQRFSNAMLGAALGKELQEGVRGFVELAAPQIARARNGGSLATAGAGLSFILAPNMQLDTAFSRGLNRRTPDLNLELGLSIRL